MPASEGSPCHDLWEVIRALRRCRWTDLTHSFDEHIPHSPMFGSASRKVLYDHAPGSGSKGYGFLAHEYHLPGQWGTHVDPPAHFPPGKRFLDEIPVTEMILPLVVIDIHDQAAKNPDYCVRMDDVRVWESRHGKVPGASFVALRSDWSKCWPDADRMLNRDASGTMHFPGWSLDVVEYLYRDCGITASGHETIDTDAGMVVSAGKAPLEAYILGLDRWQIELLTNLDQVPEHGALIAVSWPKAFRGSGFPARAFAIDAGPKENQT